MGGGGMGGGGMGGMVLSGRGGLDGGSPMDAGRGGSVSASNGPAIYPIIVINGSRATDDSLYKIKSKMDATIAIMDPAAAVAKYGKDASAGAILITAIKPKPTPKGAKKKS